MLIKAEANLHNALTELKIKYKNNTDNVLEIELVIPIDENICVESLTAEYDN